MWRAEFNRCGACVVVVVRTHKTALMNMDDCFRFKPSAYTPLKIPRSTSNRNEV